MRRRCRPSRITSEKIPFPKLGRIPTTRLRFPPAPTFPRPPDGREALKSPAGEIKISFPESCAASASRIPADTICSPIMTQSLEGATFSPRSLRVLGTSGRPRRAPTGGGPTPAPLPGQRRPGQGPSSPPPAPLRSANISCPRPRPTRSFPVGASWARSRLSARSCPNSAPPATRTRKGVPLWLGAAIGESQAPGAVGGRSGSLALGQEGGQLAGSR